MFMAAPITRNVSVPNSAALNILSCFEYCTDDFIIGSSWESDAGADNHDTWLMR